MFCVLEDVFVKYGPVRDVWVARKPPGFAFVEMEDPRDAEDAARGLDGSRICGARVKVEMSNGGKSKGGGRRGRSRSRSRSRGRSDRRRSRSRSRRRSPSYRYSCEPS
ncbi:probable splicing factor, arginine/serine-rich 6 [Eurytemora carolleeae]|uniref:probable splicing factor, arginine/serine-rich 6 n=1 Tax=Eurytemora carolleeae TaxID=1294199 RepID=UPI000C77BEC9|nr:probable splicing factor, arginine/serine-rich 6 [Eurytemora carolleeae]|eukprot:XP_023343474.1 probable splicing factor, arginine/serine-rich 6 [Eurytemora affinis]